MGLASSLIEVRIILKNYLKSIAVLLKVPKKNMNYQLYLCNLLLMDKAKFMK